MRILFQSLISALLVFKISRKTYSAALTFGLLWRFTLIVGYVSAIQAIALAFAVVSGDSELATVAGTSYTLSMFELATMVLLAFAVAAISDLLYTKFKNSTELAIEIWLTRALRSIDDKEFEFLIESKRSFSAQILIKTFDLVYSGLLLTLSLLLMTLVVPNLGVALASIGLLAYIAMWFQKRSHIDLEKNLRHQKSAARKVRQQKLLRSAKVRATTTFFAGLFLGGIVFAMDSSLLSGVSLVKLAIVAFSTRFFISFLAMFYVNVNVCSDNSKLIAEFRALVDHTAQMRLKV